MESDTYKDELRREWSLVPVRPPVIAELHPGGPDGSWLSISLTDESGPRSWLHFRKVSLYVQSAFADDDTPPAALRWEIVESIEEARVVMLEFVESFEESRSGHVGLASSPCSMPEID